MSAFLLLLVLAVFFAAGLSAGRSRSSRSEFFVAGRRGSLSTVAGSLFATVVGGSATIGVAGLVYERGLPGLWWSLVGVIGLAVLALVFAGRIRAYGSYTLPGLARALYGRAVSILVAALIVVAWSGVVSGQIVAAARVVGAAGVSDVAGWMVAFTFILVLYAVIGGQRAILRTDALQATLILLGLVTAVVALGGHVGYASGLAARLPPEALRFPVNEEFGWTGLLSMLVMVGSVYVVGPDIYTRVLSAKDALTARNAILWAAVLIVPAAVLAGVIGLTARVLAPGISSEEALPWLMANALPGGVASFLLIGLVAALMSSADSTLLGQGVVLADDVIGGLWRLSDRQAVLVSRICVGMLGLAALVLALSLRGVIASLMFAYSVFTSGVVGPVLLGLVLRGRWKPGGRAAFAGVCVGGLFGLAGSLPHTPLADRPGIPLAGLCLSIAVPLAVTAARSIGRSGKTMVE